MKNGQRVVFGQRTTTSWQWHGFFAMAVLLVLLCRPLEGASREDLWKTVDNAAASRQPRTAINALETILSGALADKAYSEAARAVAQKITLANQIEQGRNGAGKIRELESYLTNAPTEMRPILQTIQAAWLAEYAQESGYRRLREYQSFESGDLEAEDPPALHARVVHQFERILAAENELKQTSISNYSGLLLQGKLPDSYRPTLYDFVVAQAIAFHVSADTITPPGEDLLSSDPALLGPAAQFMKLPQAQATNHMAIAFMLYQKWLGFHQNDRDRTAFLDADLARIKLAGAFAQFPDADAQFKAALQAFSEQCPDNEVSARGWAALAQLEFEDGNRQKAHELALRGKNAFPQSVGGKECRSLIRQIEDPFLSVKTERTWCDPSPKIAVRYRNVPAIFFRVVPWAPKEPEEDYSAHGEREKLIHSLLKLKPVLAWYNTLPQSADYRSKTVMLDVPGSLKLGQYAILCSRNASFTTKRNELTMSPIRVSNLAVIPRSDRLEGLVLDARTGEPIKGAEITTLATIEDREEDDENDSKPAEKLKLHTDSSGLFTFPVTGGRSFDREGRAIKVRYKGSEIETAVETEADYFGPEYNHKRVFLFTDRGIYRPGQTIHYKGIFIQHDDARNNHEVMAGAEVPISLELFHGTPLNAKHHCNSYGSFSGSFRLPEHCPTGSAYLRAGPRDSRYGEVYIRVEEYKRPRFRVTLNTPESVTRLGQTVEAKGKATAYNGTPVSGAKVRYEVNRHAFLDNWGGGWQLPMHEHSWWVVAQGTCETDENGEFTIRFLAKGLNSIEEGSAIYNFDVGATVTDTQGETREGSIAIKAAKSTLHAVLSASEWLPDDQPAVVKLRTETINSKPTSALGTVRIYSLVQPATVVRPDMIYLGLTARDEGNFHFDPDEPELIDKTDYHNWPLGDRVKEQSFTTDASGETNLLFALPEGAYRAIVEANDVFGAPTHQELSFLVISPGKDRFGIKLPDALMLSSETLEPGQELQALWGTGYEAGRAFVEIECAGKTLERYWTSPGRTQARIRVPVKEEMRGGFTLRVTSVRENRAYFHHRIVKVPWTTKQLNLSWEHVKSKIEPGAKETWTAVIKPASGKPMPAEVVATLYDSSLDSLVRESHSWPHPFTQHQPRSGGDEPSIFREEGREREDWGTPRFSNYEQAMATCIFDLYEQDESDSETRSSAHGEVPALYRSFPSWLAYSRDDRRWGLRRRGFGMMYQVMTMGMAEGPKPKSTTPPKGKTDESHLSRRVAENLDAAMPRRNFSETGFFFPHLLADSNGLVRMEFTVPESLTEWRLMGFAHDTNFRSGTIEFKAVSQKQFMVEPNLPRFLREADSIQIPVKISNLSDSPQKGRVRCTFADAQTGAEISFGDTEPREQSFETGPGRSTTISVSIIAPTNCPLVRYKLVGASDTFSDGEEGLLQILPQRVLVTQSMPLPLRGPGQHNLTFSPLVDSANSSNLTHQGLTIQAVSNPSWHALLALTPLLDSSDQSANSAFQRFYASLFLRRILRNEPAIKETVQRWSELPATGPLESSPELKSVSLEETPWMLEARNETQMYASLAKSLDQSRLNDALTKGFENLAEMQLGDGSWPWYPKGRPNTFVTFSIVAGMGRLKSSGDTINEIPRGIGGPRLISRLGGLQGRDDPAIPTMRRHGLWIQSALAGVDYVDKWLSKCVSNETNVSPATVALALYARSFFLTERPVKNREAVTNCLQVLQQSWPKLSRQSQAQSVVAFQRFGDTNTSAQILKSLRERAMIDKDQGMYWREDDASWRWWSAPIESQAAAIEAFASVDDTNSVNECVCWLLNQKQTHSWHTHRATLEAVNALALARQTFSDAPAIQLTLGGNTVAFDTVQAGTGFAEKRIPGPDVLPQLGNITLCKTNEGAAWASVHWQYLQDLSAVQNQTSPLEIRKRLYSAKDGRTLQEITGPLSPGDDIVVRLEIRAKEDLEFVHLRDQRASGTEPRHTLSQHHSQGGLWYYESVRDAGTDFYIDFLPRGTWTLEYPLRAVHKGKLHSGIATVECIYAPDFRGHSAGQAFEIK